jgi:hypothetical protein
MSSKYAINVLIDNGLIRNAINYDKKESTRKGFLYLNYQTENEITENFINSKVAKYDPKGVTVFNSTITNEEEEILFLEEEEDKKKRFMDLKSKASIFTEKDRKRIRKISKKIENDKQKMHKKRTGLDIFRRYSNEILKIFPQEMIERNFLIIVNNMPLFSFTDNIDIIIEETSEEKSNDNRKETALILYEGVKKSEPIINELEEEMSIVKNETFNNFVEEKEEFKQNMLIEDWNRDEIDMITLSEHNKVILSSDFLRKNAIDSTFLNKISWKVKSKTFFRIIRNYSDIYRNLKFVQDSKIDGVKDEDIMIEGTRELITYNNLCCLLLNMKTENLIDNSLENDENSIILCSKECSDKRLIKKKEKIKFDHQMTMPESRIDLTEMLSLAQIEYKDIYTKIQFSILNEGISVFCSKFDFDLDFIALSHLDNSVFFRRKISDGSIRRKTEEEDLHKRYNIKILSSLASVRLTENLVEELCENFRIKDNVEILDYKEQVIEMSLIKNRLKKIDENLIDLIDNNNLHHYFSNEIKKEEEEQYQVTNFNLQYDDDSSDEENDDMF